MCMHGFPYALALWNSVVHSGEKHIDKKSLAAETWLELYEHDGIDGGSMRMKFEPVRADEGLDRLKD